MYVSPDSVILTPNNKRNLTVCLKPYKTIYDMTPCLLKLTGLVNIIFLVKTCLKLYKYRHLLTIFRRLGK